MESDHVPPLELVALSAHRDHKAACLLLAVLAHTSLLTRHPPPQGRFGCFQFGVVMNSDCTHSCTGLCVNIVFFPLDKCPGGDCWVTWSGVCTGTRNCPVQSGGDDPAPASAVSLPPAPGCQTSRPCVVTVSLHSTHQVHSGISGL